MVVSFIRVNTLAIAEPFRCLVDFIKVVEFLGDSATDDICELLHCRGNRLTSRKDFCLLVFKSEYAFKGIATFNSAQLTRVNLVVQFADGLVLLPHIQCKIVVLGVEKEIGLS